MQPVEACSGGCIKKAYKAIPTSYALTLCHHIAPIAIINNALSIS